MVYFARYFDVQTKKIDPTSYVAFRNNIDMKNVQKSVTIFSTEFK